MATYIPRVSEADEQIAVLTWANMMSHRFPCLKFMYHTPNGGSRNIAEAANLKRMGVKPGVPDLFLPYPSKGFHGLWIEMKTEKGRQTASQKEWQEWLNENGYLALVCHGVGEAINALEGYLNERGVD